MGYMGYERVVWRKGDVCRLHTSTELLMSSLKPCGSNGHIFLDSECVGMSFMSNDELLVSGGIIVVLGESLFMDSPVV